MKFRLFYMRIDIKRQNVSYICIRNNIISMEKTKLSVIVKALRKESGLTQEDLAMKSGVGLCFVRNLEQGKTTLRMDKVNQLLDLFNYELTATKKTE